MTLDDWIKEAKGRCDSATEGPWELTDLPAELNRPGQTIINLKGPYKDSLFIAHSRTDLPKALRIIEALSSVVNELIEFIPFDHEYSGDCSGCIADEMLFKARAKAEEIANETR